MSCYTGRENYKMVYQGLIFNVFTLWIYFGQTSCQGCERGPDHAYKFQIGDNYGAYEYRDERGYKKGFNIDLVNAVCEKAGKTCYTVMDRHTHCWESKDGNEHPGIGLLGGWYDGCMGIYPSPERYNAFDFSYSYTPNYKAGVYYRKGAGFLDNDPKNLTNQKIGFIDGWAVSQQCLHRQLGFAGSSQGMYEAVMYDSHEDMVKDLMLNKIGAILTGNGFDMDKLGLSHAEPLFECTTGGAALMVRYGDDVLDWWNDAFMQLVQSGEFMELCEKSETEHGYRGKVNCAFDFGVPMSKATLMSRPSEFLFLSSSFIVSLLYSN